MRRDPIDDPAAEARDRIGGRPARHVGVSAQLDGEQVEPWIETDHELGALALHGLG